MVRRAVDVGWVKPHIFYHGGYWFCLTYVSGSMARCGLSVSPRLAWWMWKLKPRYMTWR
jgi:hypothetical protein